MSVIGAVATPYGIGGIAVIRLSGENALDVAARAFKPVGGKSLAELKGYEACYGRIYDGEKLVDDGVLLYFQAPKSYTGEDVVEISCHGGILISKAVLQAFFKAGATPAQAGEFTKRAVLNGKLSLTQAEAVIDVINAQSKQFLDYCNVQKQGALYRHLEKITDRLLAVSAQLAVWADYPDEDIPEAQAVEIADRLHLETTELNSLLSSYDTGKILRDGISAAIVGKPNAGKSTLMNLLAGEEKSIVTDIEGTTRDIVEESVDVGGIVLRLADCAGIRETDDPVEKIGVERMKSRLASSQLVLAVFDGSRALEKPDFELIQRLDGKKVICIINKNDLEQQLDTAFLRDKFENIVELSAKNDDNTERLNALIMRLADVENLDMSAGFIANERQRACAVAAKNALIEAENAISSGFTLDVAGIMVEQALESLYELSGKRAGDEIIAEVFKRFCVGK